MNHHGMKSLKIYNYEDPQTGNEESIIHFTADKSHFEHVTVSTGRVFGPKNHNFNLEGSRIILGEPTENTTKLLLQEGKCKFENVDEFLVSFFCNSLPCQTCRFQYNVNFKAE